MGQIQQSKISFELDSPFKPAGINLKRSTPSSMDWSRAGSISVDGGNRFGQDIYDGKCHRKGCSDRLSFSVNTQNARGTTLLGVSGVFSTQRCSLLCQLLRLLPAGSLYSTARHLHRKDASINEEIDRLRLATTSALVSRRDCIIIASVSCIYGLGSPRITSEWLSLCDAAKRSIAKSSCYSGSISNTNGMILRSSVVNFECVATPSSCGQLMKSSPIDSSSGATN